MTEGWTPPGGFPDPSGQPTPPPAYPGPAHPPAYPPPAYPGPAYPPPAYPGPAYPGPAYPPPAYPPPAYPPQAYPAQVPPPVPMPTEPVGYHEIHRGGAVGWWRPLIGIPAVLVSTFLVSPTVWLLPFVLWFAATGQPVKDSVAALGDIENVTPTMLTFVNLSLASAIPIAWFFTWVLHGLKPGWLSSVRPRLRWGYLAVCFGLSVVALVATILVSLVLPAEGDAAATGELNEFTSKTRDFMLVILLLTPFQAAGEEYAFRGYLTQAFGGLFAPLGPAVSRTVAVLAPALLFALAHGLGQSIPVFFDRFAFGVVAGILVIVTGGLEAGIAMHVLNNFLAFGFALAFGDMGDSLNPTGGSWWMIPSTLTQSLVYLGLAWFAARKMGLATRAEPAVLAASRGLVYRVPSAQPPAPQW